MFLPGGRADRPQQLQVAGVCAGPGRWEAGLVDAGLADTRPPGWWWQGLPAVEATVACGSQGHVIRWADGALAVPGHPDAEAELVLRALGGGSAVCLTVARLWERHTGDLDALVLGPRGPADRVQLSWEDIGWPGPPAGVRPFGPAGPRSPWRWHGFRGTLDPAGERRLELLALLGLGPAFQLRLAGAVAATWSEAGAAQRRAQGPVLAAALSGRLAIAAGEWLGLEPGRVRAVPHEGPGWGSVATASSGHRPGPRVSLPLSWLARVWACGLAVVGGHLVVAVLAARWPRARVLALPEPGAEPVVLHLLAAPDAGEPGTGSRWRVADGAEAAGPWP